MSLLATKVYKLLPATVIWGRSNSTPALFSRHKCFSVVIQPVRFEKHVTAEFVMFKIHVTRELADELGPNELTRKGV